MTDRPLRFGVSTSSAADRDEWRQRARQYEGIGFDTLVVADHLGGVLSPMTALLAAAEATERLRIGTFVLNNDFWSPLLLAREAVTLDQLSGGRLELGVGAGHAREEYEAAGLRYGPPAVRVARLAETVPVLRRLLDGETRRSASPRRNPASRCWSGATATLSSPPRPPTPTRWAWSASRPGRAAGTPTSATSPGPAWMSASPTCAVPRARAPTRSS